jgi:GAF domain-containing protein
MRRRSRASSKLANARSRKTVKRRTPSKDAQRRGASAGHEAKVERLTRERDEALLRETANSEVLRLISSSPGDLELVFRTILENATRICNANFGNLFRFDGEIFYPAAQFNTPAALLEAITRRGAFKPTPGISLDHVMRTKQVFHSADMAAEPVPGLAPKLGGARTQVTVPMLKDEALIGAILIYRQEVRPFTDKQIALVTTFADQAVIAIENARLLNELRQSLEQQTATADVLAVISSSPGALEPVFKALLEKATRLCEAKFGNLFLRRENCFQHVAMHGAPSAYMALGKALVVLSEHPYSPLAEAVRTKQTVHVTDMSAHQSYLKQDERIVALVDAAGARTLLTVPMLKDDDPVGAIVIYRQEARAFTDKQIALVQNFAAQAVSPSRMRGCLTNCVNRWSSKRRRRTCCASSVHHRESWSRCSRQCWRMRRASARQNSAIYIFAKGTRFARSQCTTCRRRLPRRGGITLWFAPNQAARLAASAVLRAWFTFLTSPQNKAISSASQGLSPWWSSAAFEPCLRYQCLRTES